MNASDDRSPDIFKQQLEAATQMKAVIGKNPKPNCLIIDEIDGAPAVRFFKPTLCINVLSFAFTFDHSISFYAAVDRGSHQVCKRRIKS